MRRAGLALALLGLLGCHHGKAGYASFQDVPYDYPAGRLVWCPQAGLHVYVAELGPRASEKPPLVLLHPWGLSMTVWSDIAPPARPGGWCWWTSPGMASRTSSTPATR